MSKLRRMDGDPARRMLRGLSERLKPWLDFWAKINNDWIFNLAGLLAYNFLMSLFPILLVILAVLGFIFGGLAPQILDAMQQQIELLAPGGAEVFEAATQYLANSAGPLLVLGVLAAGFTGSRLFIVIENCFGIIFRVRGRDFIQQNVMAFGMLFLYLILIPIITQASVIPAAVMRFIAPHVYDTNAPVLTTVISIAVALVSALILFGSIYLFVPNKVVHFREIWPGTILAAILVIAYLGLFPLYVELFLHPNNYGSLAGFVIVVLLFFYYLAFIVLLGAELNSWIAGQRPTDGDPPWIYHKLTKERRSNAAHNHDRDSESRQ